MAIVPGEVERLRPPWVGCLTGRAEELRVEPGQQLPDLRDLFEGGRLADGGQLLRPHELRRVTPPHVRLDHHVRRLHAEGVQVVVLDQ